jgi:hypothetical protein
MKAVIMDAIENAGQTGTMAEAVSRTVARTFENVADAPDALVHATSEVAQGAIQAVLDVGGDLSAAARGVVIGVVRGTRGGAFDPAGAMARGRGGVSDFNPIFNPIRHSSESIVRSTARLSGDLASAARGAVQGAIHGALEANLDAKEAATVAAHGAMKAAGELGTTAGDRVRLALSEPIEGVRVTLRETFRPGGASTAGPDGHQGGRGVSHRGRK